MSNHVTIYCDGSGIAGGHPCGFAAVLQCYGKSREVVGSLDIGTNNVAELMAAIIGLETLKGCCTVILRSDSAYVVNAMIHGWWKKWERNGWQRLKDTRDGAQAEWVLVPNAEYWQRLLDAAAPHHVTFEHVKGHNGDPLNERCDKLAKQARRAHGYKPTVPAYDAEGNRLQPA